MDIVSCIVCGIGIALSSRESEPRPTWLAEYRAIYREFSTIKITGIGRYVDYAVGTPPQNSLKRWDDEDHAPITLNLNHNYKRNHTHGFAIHNSCWKLLQKAFEPAEIPLQRVLDVCESLPFLGSSVRIIWGHDYGGLRPDFPCISFAWEDRFDRSPLSLSSSSKQIQKEALYDPLTNLGISQMLSITTRPPFETPFESAIRPRDCFVSLPWEIRDMIGSLLSTRDALNLRQASASFLPLYTSESFWASRFSPDAELGFLFEAKNIRKPQRYLDWINMRKATWRKIAGTGSDSATLRRKAKRRKIAGIDSDSATLRNRKRVWSLAKEIICICQRFRHEAPYGTIIAIPNRDTSRLVSGLVDSRPKLEHGEWFFFTKGCRALHTVLAVLPDNLKQIGITKIEVGLQTYVTGLRFIPKNGHDTKIGYVVKHEEKVFELNSLHGIGVALSKSGIRGLRLADENNRYSNWAGDPSNMLMCDRLLKSEPIRRLIVSYDAFKIVGLGLDDDTTPVPKGGISPRDELWYPHCPPKSAYINNISIHWSLHLHTDFNHYIMLEFGGPGGTYLPYLKAVGVQFEFGLRSIVFHYERNPYIDTSQILILDFWIQVPRTSLFEIDGKSGERITGVILSDPAEGLDTRRSGAIHRIQFETNWNRSWKFGARHWSGTQRLALANNTTITGIYAHRNSSIGIYGLGLISEAIREFH